MAVRLEAVTFDVAEVSEVAAFWAELLGRDVVAEPRGALVPGDGTQVGLRFAASDTEQLGRPRLHLHLTSTSPEDQHRIVDTVLRLGGRHLVVGQDPDADYVVMADPGGNELCVIDPDNRFLAGTGPLGEVTCDGTRAVGLFWCDALGWPLGWDEAEETSIQSPLGGTKLSWGGPPVAPRHGRNRQRFDLVSTDPAYDVERLLSLGATRRVDLADDGVELADPDGNEFTLRAVQASDEATAPRPDLDATGRDT